MSYSTVLGVTPNRRPVPLAVFTNGHGWSPSIWRRLLTHHGHDENWRTNDPALNALWQSIETLPEWQQAPLILTFDTGVIPCQAFDWTAAHLEEFEKRLPSSDNYVNHVPAMIDLLRTHPETPLLGVHATSVTDNFFDPWDSEADQPGSGIPLDEMYVLERHRHFLTGSWRPPAAPSSEGT